MLSGSLHCLMPLPTLPLSPSATPTIPQVSSGNDIVPHTALEANTWVPMSMCLICRQTKDKSNLYHSIQSGGYPSPLAKSLLMGIYKWLFLTLVWLEFAIRELTSILQSHQTFVQCFFEMTPALPFGQGESRPRLGCTSY